MKRTIKLTESDLHRIVRNSVKHVIKESHIGISSDTMDLYNELVDAGYEKEIIGRLISYIGEPTFKHILEEIYDGSDINIDNDELPSEDNYLTDTWD